MRLYVWLGSKSSTITQSVTMVAIELLRQQKKKYFRKSILTHFLQQKKRSQNWSSLASVAKKEEWTRSPKV